MRLSGPQNRSGRSGQHKVLLLPGLEIRPHDSAAHNQSLHRLRYPVALNFRESLFLKYRVDTRSRQGGRCVREP
jgi:hypothetical protein